MASNGLYYVTKLLQDEFKSKGFNTITFGDPSQVDLNKQNIYPLMHMTLQNRTIGEQAEVFTINIVWLDILYFSKDQDQRTVTDTMSQTDNTEDVLHDLGFRINQGWRSLKRNDTSNELPVDINIQAFYAKGQNRLAGYEAQLLITIVNPDLC